MRALLLGALSLHLGACVLLVGTFFMPLLAGASPAPTVRRWEATLLAWSRRLVLLALASGYVWLLARTSVFENRPAAALDPRAVWHAVLDTWPGFVWLARHGILLVLGAFLGFAADTPQRRDWIAARAQALALAVLALALLSASSHAAAIAPGTARAVAVDVVHVAATGLWLGALVPLGLLLRAASRDDGADAREHAIRAARRFSRAALLAMLVLIVSGVLNALAQVETIGALAGTTHGHLLLAKLALLAPILALAAVNRTHILPTVSAPNAMRRLATFAGVEAGLALALLACAAAMTLTTPARHAEAVWPLPFRISPELLDVPAARWRALIGSQLAMVGAVVLLASPLVRRRRAPLRAGALALIAIGGGVALRPLVVDAYPTTYRRPLATYHAGSIAAGHVVFQQQCAGCHGPAAGGSRADLRAPATTRRHAGELFWLVSHGIPDRGMPGFATRLTEAQRWNLINYIRALAAAEGAKSIGRQVEIGRAWLAAPDFTVAVGPLAPGALRDQRGRRMVLVVLYTLPGSRARMTELARTYNLLSAIGVEVIAVPMDGSPEALRELGSSPPVLFPVVTEGAADIVTTYGLLAPGPHAEVLIDRQGYIRASWRESSGGIPDAAAVQSQVEKLNEEKSPPAFPDDHVH